jgi:hypothetical protein
MQLTISSDEAGQQICRHVRNWRIITLLTIDHNMIHVYAVQSLKTYLYKINFNIIFSFYLDIRSSVLFSGFRRNILIYVLYPIIIFYSYKSVSLQMSAINGGVDHYAICSRPQ